jgi:hypothetical protein
LDAEVVVDLAQVGGVYPLNGNTYLTKESIDFEDTLAGKGFLNNVENFARPSKTSYLVVSHALYLYR